jgi:hypothetical protein
MREERMYPEDVDDVDMLFARLEPVVPPPDLHSRVVARAQGRARHRHVLGYALLTISVLLAAIISFGIGQELQASGALALVDVLGDIELLDDEPFDLLFVALDVTPWPLTALIGAALAMVVVATRLALSPSIRFARRSEG